jgi:2-polyprenyl-6-methoxyphenol hydroxylase-like FAD-dependent oxidoreductase
LGDAAHSVHPLAGQGLNLGLNDVAVLANCILKNKKAGHDFGRLSYLEEYESNAKLYNYQMATGLEFIK